MTAIAPIRWPQIGRFALHALRWLAAAWFLGLAYILGRVWLKAKADGAEVTVAFSHGRLELASANGSTRFGPAFFVFLLGMAVAVALLTWALRKTPRREFFIHHGILLVATAGVTCLLWDWRGPTSAYVGQPMPPLAVDYLSVPPDLRGHVVLVEFWATWCGPCIANIPHLNELQEKFRERGFVVVGISGEEDRAVVERFWRKGEMHYAVAVQPGGALQHQLGVRGIPHSFLVDQTGRIVWEGHPYGLTESIVEAALN